MAKRIFLFVIVNVLVILTISIVLAIFGVGNYVTPYGLDYGSLLAMCAVFGFSGALISLAMSRFMAKMMMGVRVIDPNSPASSLERDLLQTIHRLSQKAGLPRMPEVGIYESPEVNAFATGPTKSRALVAVSTGLLQRMDGAAVEGVLGHEIAHVANGDMVTMTLIQGVVNTFVMFFARIAAWGLTQAMSSRDREEGGSVSPIAHYFAVIVFEMIFALFGMIVVNWFSRLREYRADAGGASLTTRDKMIHALQSLKRTTELVDDSHQSLATLKISSKPHGLLALLATHPPLEERIARLQRG